MVSNGQTRQEGDYLLAWLLLTDTKAIKDYYQGKNKSALEPPVNRCLWGEWGGEKYDFVARDPLTNHIAMCHVPRSENYNLRMGILDSMDDPDPKPEPIPKEPKKMAILKLGTQQVDIDDNAHAAVSTYIAGLEKSLAESRENAEKFEALYDSKDQELKTTQASGQYISYQKFMEFAQLMEAAKDLPKKYLTP